MSFRSRRNPARECSRFFNDGGSMFRSTKFLAVACLTAGTLLGYAAASGKLNPFARAEAAPPEGASAVEKTGGPQPGDPACCPEGASKSQLLALADPKV